MSQTPAPSGGSMPPGDNKKLVAGLCGILLGGLGALTGFLASSLVNYNYGDGEAVMLFWWLMGVCVFFTSRDPLVRSGP